MFVAAGARQRLLGQRRDQFTERYLRPLLTEATRLGIDAGELIELISDFARQQAGDSTARPARARADRGGVPV
jgi:DNA-binding transcriptional regulator YhcF (GntR family)